MLRWPRRQAVVEITTVGPYELQVEVLRAGTRSEGRTGRLFHRGSEIRGTRPGETIVVDPKSPGFVYVGDARPHLWSVSGWTIERPESPTMGSPDSTELGRDQWEAAGRRSGPGHTP